MIKTRKDQRIDMFCDENKDAIQWINKILKEAGGIYEELGRSSRMSTNHTSLRELGGYYDESKWFRYLDPAAIDILNDEDAPIAHSSPGLIKYNLNMFGYLKTGERSIRELDDDIATSHSVSDSNGIITFDLYNAILVGINIGSNPANSLVEIFKDGISRINGNFCSVDCNMGYMVDISTVLIRHINRLLSNPSSNIQLLEDLRHSIIKICISKAIRMSISIDQMMKEVINSIKVSPADKTMKSSDAIRFLFIYKVYYNIINGLKESTYNKNIDRLNAFLDASVLGYSMDTGTDIASRVLMNEFINSSFDVLRYPDQLIRKQMDIHQVAIRSFGKGRNGDWLTVNSLNAKNELRHGETFSIESYQDGLMEDLGLSYEFFSEAALSDNNTKSAYGFMGIESALNSNEKFAITQEQFRTMLKINRSELLNKLSSKERKMFCDYENEINRLTARSNNCYDLIEQETILNDSARLSKLISIEVERANKNNNDELVVILNGLDAMRAEVIAKLVERQIKRERMSFGSISRVGTISDKYKY